MVVAAAAAAAAVVVVVVVVAATVAAAVEVAVVIVSISLYFSHWCVYSDCDKGAVKVEHNLCTRQM